MEKLEKQIGTREDVEIISIMDNKSFGISQKRNELMKLARGSHLTWIDDDDDVADNYVDRLTETIEKNPDVDVISFNQICFLEGKEANVFSKMGNPHEDVIPDPLNPDRYQDTLRPPYHWCVWKSSLAKSENFRSEVRLAGSDYGEDIDWLRRLYPQVKNSIYLESDVLHIYRYSKNISESL
jgi:glycosyltransferase involved in cell wall biosynthesis